MSEILVVSDTSPIRALDHLGLVELLRDLFGGVWIPPAVADELRHPPRGRAAIEPEGWDFVRLEAPSDRARVEAFRAGLDPGESEALALALEIGAATILIDEAAGRRAARSLGLAPLGVLGLLLRAKQGGRVAALRPLLDRLRRELGFYLSDALCEQALRRAGEASPPPA